MRCPSLRDVSRDMGCGAMAMYVNERSCISLASNLGTRNSKENPG